MLPKHVAIVMDGNGRWAKTKNLPRVAGHEAGAESVKKIVQLCIEKGIQVLTLFAFSSENWQRPSEEVAHLMQLFLQSLRQETQSLLKNNIRLMVIGDRRRFSEELRQQISTSEQLTENNSGLVLVIAANYSGRWDITHALEKIAEDLITGTMSIKEIDTSVISQHLSLSSLPEPDLFIRTSGEQRISNFMLWQFAYTELYFSSVLWPDFQEKEFELALEFFRTRERRFGLTSEQIYKDPLNA